MLREHIHSLDATALLVWDHNVQVVQAGQRRGTGHAELKVRAMRVMQHNPAVFPTDNGMINVILHARMPRQDALQFTRHTLGVNRLRLPVTGGTQVQEPHFGGDFGSNFDKKVLL